jgi:hypothetical protein
MKSLVQGGFVFVHKHHDSLQRGNIHEDSNNKSNQFPLCASRLCGEFIFFCKLSRLRREALPYRTGETLPSAN